MTPSSLNASQVYEGVQKDSHQKILDDRPDRDEGIPPLPLLYAGFGRFQDDLDHAFDNPGILHEEPGLKGLVDTLGSKMRGFGLEIKQSDETLGPLQKALGIESKVLLHDAQAHTSKAATGGHLLADDEGPFIVIEYKRSLATAEPQMAGYFSRLTVDVDSSVFRGRRYPALGVVVRGEV